MKQKRRQENLIARQAAWSRMSAKDQAACKKPGSEKK